ncbi:endo-1,4-beta-xylanase [Streptomyces longwoodensis]|uniref:endo-1,4-beta-xylanase n=1 Tax=Streptomyces longwoodensis TaxID=68231 RepID=UPI0036E8A218
MGRCYRLCIPLRQFWGFTDRYSWVPGVFEGEGAANLLDEDYGVKPAFRAVQKALSGHARTKSATR